MAIQEGSIQSGLGFRPVELTFGQKVWSINWPLVLIVLVIAGVGFLTLYSTAGGTSATWVMRQLIRFAIGVVAMFVVALVDIRLWYRFAYAGYLGALGLLVVVEVLGTIEMGAQRWVNIGVFNLQPSEIMKLALVLALARYFHGRSDEQVGEMRWLLAPLLMIAVPVALVLRQPDLGTAVLIVLGGLAILFLAGVKIWKFAVAFVATASAIPLIWGYLHDYQKNRVLTFFDPERDPLGAGYHIIQSKIALGSGGLFGKGYMQGTQSHLNFLPEKHTDFIFTVFAEEFGLFGGLGLLTLYTLVIAAGFIIALRARNQFGRLLGLGVTATFFIYVFINVAMVMGLIPVVGVPLPLISYGGTAMVTIFAGFGLLMNVHIHREVRIPRRPGSVEN
ncbi:MAG: rod shape-determining protein RodA [Proteobacteria bacterium]|nr:rod shape-determining protein RodA [Pseudomonadota bacterium]